MIKARACAHATRRKLNTRTFLTQKKNYEKISRSTAHIHILTDTLHRRKTLISPNFCKKSASPQDKIYFSHTCTCVYHTLYNEVSFGSPAIDILHCFLLRQMVRSYQREESNRVYLISSEPQIHAHHYSHSDKLSHLMKQQLVT